MEKLRCQWKPPAHLKCRLCGKQYPKEPLNFCTDDFGPLEVAYDYEEVSRTMTRAAIEPVPIDVEVPRTLPLDGEPTVGLHVGSTPLVRPTGSPGFWACRNSISRTMPSIIRRSRSRISNT